MPKKRGKKYIEAAKKIEAALAGNGNGGLTPEAAVQMAKETSISKFDATVEAHIRLGVDPRHAEQMVRGSVVLPNGTGKKVRVLVFATADRAKEAQEAGADFVGGDDLVKKVSEGWTDFDAAIATPDIMSKVGPLGKILGPRGLMPNPKSGTVTFDVARAVREVKGGKVEFRTDKFGIVHAPIGKVSFGGEQLHQNLTALVDALIRNKPTTSKGQYLRTFFVAATQGPSVPVDVKEAAKLHTSSEVGADLVRAGSPRPHGRAHAGLRRLLPSRARSRPASPGIASARPARAGTR
jgi:large subunit ribosomal protein L1